MNWMDWGFQPLTSLTCIPPPLSDSRPFVRFLCVLNPWASNDHISTIPLLSVIRQYSFLLYRIPHRSFVAEWWLHSCAINRHVLGPSYTGSWILARVGAYSRVCRHRLTALSPDGLVSSDHQHYHSICLILEFVFRPILCLHSYLAGCRHQNT